MHQSPDVLSSLVEAYGDFAAAHGVIDEPDDVTAYPFRPGPYGDLVPEG